MAEALENAFLNSFKKSLLWDRLSLEIQSFVQELSQQQANDFASTSGGYFSHESQEEIAREAAQRLAKQLSAKEISQIELNLIRQEWQQIVKDFYQNQFWGQVPQKSKPKKILSEDQKRVRELAPYIWAAFQAWIVMKLVIFYFGLEAADNPEETHWFLYLAIGFSAFSLCFFVWRQLKKGE